jgi:pimeloyl-ACP methyl ester carboxylesterase
MYKQKLSHLALLISVIILLIGQLVSVTHANAWAQTGQKLSAWTAVDCSEFKINNLTADSGVDCGYVTAPLKHAEPDGPTIQLAVVILPAVDADKEPDPLFIAQGGPGGSTIGTYADFLITEPNSRQSTNRDIVLWDQRGTLYSKPPLLCPEVSQADLSNALADAAPASDAEDSEPYQACGTRLAGEAGDLSAFNSSENADDIETLRVALGYDQINFYGVSYGTELGQFIMRQQPGHLRSVILDAVVPLDYNLLTEPAFAKERIAEKYFDACAADARCNAAFPNLAQRYLALVDRLNAEPVDVSVSTVELLGGQVYQVKLTGSMLESALYASLYSNVHDLVPLIIDEADKGNYVFVTGTLLPSILFDDTFATGMHLAVACAERGDTDPGAVDYSMINPRLAEEERQSAEAELSICKSWGIELLPRTDLEPIVSDIPTLLLSGDFDPITPPEYAAKLLPTLSNGRHVIFPGGEHGQAVTNSCANDIIGSFLDTPTGEIDVSCADKPVSNFLTAEDVISLPPLKSALEQKGFGGLLASAGKIAPDLLVGLFLLSVIPVYGLGWLISLSRRNKSNNNDDESTGWTRNWAHRAPWLALLTALVLLVFVGLLIFAVSSTVMVDQNLAFLGAIPASWRWLFILPPLFFILVVLMVVATVAMWIGRHRSLGGRIYYTLMTLASISAVSGLIKIGVMWLAFS